MSSAIKERTLQFIKAEGISVKAFEERCGLSNGYIKSMRRGYGADKLRNVLCAFPGLSRDWLLFGDGEMLVSKSATVVAKKSFDRGVPYYDVDFVMGFDFMVNDQTANPSYLIDCQPYNNCDYWCNVRGDSMSPTIAGGDIVALKQIHDISYLINGEIYAIITKNGLRTIKRVNDNGETLTLIPDNKAYSSQEISKDVVSALFSVRASLKML